MAPPAPGADGTGRIRPRKAPVSCLPRSIGLGGGNRARAGSGSRAGLSPALHMEGRAGSAVVGKPSGVQFQGPDLLGPARPALQLLPAVAQRLRVDLGLLRERRRGEGGERSDQRDLGPGHLVPASGLQPSPRFLPTRG